MEKQKEKFPYKSIMYAIGVLYFSIIPIHYYLKIILSVILGIFAARKFFYSKEIDEKSKTYKINKGIIALLTIFITINLTSDYDNLRDLEKRETKIKYQLTALQTNTAVNLTKVNRLTEGFKLEVVNGKHVERVSEERLDSEYAYQLLRDPDLYQFCGYGLITAINAMAQRLDTVNNNSEYARSNYNQESYNLVKGSLLEAKYRVMVVQYALDYYLNSYSAYFNEESNYREIQALNHVKNLDNLNKYIENLQERSNEFRRSLQDQKKPKFVLYKPYNQR